MSRLCPWERWESAAGASCWGWCILLRVSLNRKVPLRFICAIGGAGEAAGEAQPRRREFEVGRRGGGLQGQARSKGGEASEKIAIQVAKLRRKPLKRLDSDEGMGIITLTKVRRDVDGPGQAGAHMNPVTVEMREAGAAILSDSDFSFSPSEAAEAVYISMECARLNLRNPYFGHPYRVRRKST